MSWSKVNLSAMKIAIKIVDPSAAVGELVVEDLSGCAWALVVDV